MSRRIASIPAVALTLDQAAEVAGVPKQLLLGQIFHGYLRAKRTSQPYRHGESSWGLSSTGGKYLVGADDLLDWIADYPLPPQASADSAAESPQRVPKTLRPTQ